MQMASKAVGEGKRLGHASYSCRCCLMRKLRGVQAMKSCNLQRDSDLVEQEDISEIALQYMADYLCELVLSLY